MSLLKNLGKALALTGALALPFITGFSCSSVQKKINETPYKSSLTEQNFPKKFTTPNYTDNEITNLREEINTINLLPSDQSFLWSRLRLLEELKRNYSKEDINFSEIIMKEFQNETVESFDDVIYNRESMLNLDEKIRKSLYDYLEPKFKITKSALNKERLRYELGSLENEIIKVEKVISSHEKNLSVDIYYDYLKLLDDSARKYQEFPKFEDLEDNAISFFLLNNISDEISFGTAYNAYLLTLKKQREIQLVQSEKNRDIINTDKVSKIFYDNILFEIEDRFSKEGQKLPLNKLSKNIIAYRVDRYMYKHLGVFDYMIWGLTKEIYMNKIKKEFDNKLSLP